MRVANVFDSCGNGHVSGGGGLRLECDFAGIKIKSSQIVGSLEWVLRKRLEKSDDHSNNMKHFSNIILIYYV